ncbi:MAG: hypothetical protein WCW33_04690 [Candidatus Babeliales bacterium]|jgi:hypothetical protein
MVTWSVVKKEKYFLILLFLASLVVRLAFFSAYTRHHITENLVFDAEQYHHVALQIAHGNGITTKEGTPNFYRLPGYPLFLGACYAATNDTVETTLWVQVILASIIPLLIWVLGMVMFPSVPLVAWLASLLSVFHLGLVIYAGMLLSESLFLIFFLLFLILFFTALAGGRSSMWLMASSGVILGFASLIRAIGPYVIALSFMLIVICCATWRLRLRMMAILGSSWLLVVGMWLVRNFLLTGAFFFHTLPGLHFLQYSAVYVVMDQDDLDYFQAKKKVLSAWEKMVEDEEHALGKKLSEYERYARAERLAFRILAAHPLNALKHAFTHIVRTCGTLNSTLLLYVPRGTVYGKDASLWFKIKLYLTPRVLDPWLIPIIYWELVLSLFIVVGMMVVLLRALWDRCARRIVVMILPFVILFVGITLAYGCARLRLPVEPLLLLGAVYGWLGLFQT